MKNFKLSLEIILLITSLLLIITYNFKFPIDADAHYFIKSGEEIYLLKGFPVYDSFSWVPVEQKVPYVNWEWLTCLIFYVIYNKGGFLYLTFYKTVLYGLSYFIMFFICKKKYGLLSASLSIIIAIYIGRCFLAPRAMVHTAVLFPVAIIMLLYDQDTYFDKRQLFYFPILFLVWSNLHAGFIVGMAFVFVGFLINYYFKVKKITNKKKKQLFLSYLLLVCLCLIAVMVNPYGPKVFLKILEFFTPRSIEVFIKYNTEYQSPLSYIKYFDYYIIAVFLSIMGLFFYYFRYRITLSPVEFYTYLFFLLISLRAVRNIQLFSIAIIPVFAFLFYNTIEIKKNFFNSPVSEKVSFLFVFLKIICLTGILYYFVTVLSGLDPTAKSTEKKLFPVNLKEYLIKNDLPQNLYNHEIAGSYLLFTYPKYKVCIDTREPLVYKPDYFIELGATYSDHETFMRFVDKYNIDLCIMDLKYHPDLLASHKRGWLLLYEEGRYKLYLRSNERNKKIIDKFKNDELVYPNIYECHAFLYLNFIELKDYRKSRKYLRKLINYYPEDKKLWSYLREIDRLIELDNHKKGR